MNRFSILILGLSLIMITNSCRDEAVPVSSSGLDTVEVKRGIDIQSKVVQYAPFQLTADLSGLTEDQKVMIPLLIEASEIMDTLFWYQAFGGKDTLMPAIEDENIKKYVEINYGPWDRLNADASFLTAYGPKPAGANFYPHDMTKEEFEAAELPDKAGLYTFIRRNEDGYLESIGYHEMFPEKLKRAANLLREAADLADDEGFRRYLALRADALESDQFYASDAAWMEMQDNLIDLVIGPIETYEDQLFGYKTGYESYILIKDKEWSQRLDKYTAFLPWLQSELPVEEKYRVELPGTSSQLNAYDVIYYSGHSNAGSKTIAINLPNDPEIQKKFGSRRLQLKNAMRAKYDQILVPLSKELIVDEQQQYVTFDAFFGNTMFHEVAHGLGIKDVIDDTITVRNALKEHASALEEGKADVLGIYMITKLYEKGELGGVELMDYYTTFLASIFRSIRFGASSAHGKANMVRFNYFREMGAFSRTDEGQYRVDQEKFKSAINALSNEILVIQGEGDFDRAAKLLNEKGVIGAELQADLDRLEEAGIPVDIIFHQGKDQLGL